ncbi:MAG: hypothetical protein ACOC2H_06480 [Spirochaetota bacterium]
MERMVSDCLLPFINQGTLTMEKVNILAGLKEFIDRVSTRTYIGENTLASLVEKFGVEPDIVSWGDYFQSELAFDAVRYGVDELQQVVNTVKFDVMSAFQIFRDHESEFFEWVEQNSNEIIMSGSEDYSEEEQEILHLKILKDYYCNMGITDAFTPDEIRWYTSFSGTSQECVS